MGGASAILAVLLGRLRDVPFSASPRTAMAQLKAAHALITHQGTSSKVLGRSGRALVNALVNERLLPALACTSSSSSSSSWSAAAEKMELACLEAIHAIMSRSTATSTSFVHDRGDSGFKILSAAFGKLRPGAVQEAALRCVVVAACSEPLGGQVVGAIAQVTTSHLQEKIADSMLLVIKVICAADR
jgi:hypothetical protein